MRLKSLALASLLSAFISVLSLISCSTNSNFGTVDSERRYEYAHIQLGEKTCHDNILSWRTYSDQEVVLNLKKYGEIRTSLQNVLLYNTNKCPVCNN